MDNPSTTAQQNRRPENGRLIIIVLVLLFTAPLASSWLIVKYSDLFNARGAGHGDMYQPLRQLADAPLFDPFGEGAEAEHLHGKWTLLYISVGQCDEACRENIYRMRQIRLAVSRYAGRLQRVWMTDLTDPGVLRSLLEEYRGTKLVDFNRARNTLSPEYFALGEDDDPLQADHLYVIDPLGNLVLRYRMDTDPTGIIKDLRRLLRNSRIG